MRDVIRAQWLAFSEPIEGGIQNPYSDIRGKVTIAFGNLVDSPGDVAALPLVHPDGTPATTSEKVAVWNRLHDDPNAAKGGWHYAAKLTDLRLPREAMNALAMAKLENNDRVLRARVRDWEDHNACCQMAMHSWSWACGPNGHWPRLFQAVTDRDYLRAAVEIHINEITPEGIYNAGLVTRNTADRILMRNAARVLAFHLDENIIDWEHDLAVSEAPTLDELPNPDSEPDNSASQPTTYPGPCDKG